MEDTKEYKGLVMCMVVCVLCSLCGCVEYGRKENCHLDKLHVKGDVVKIETIVRSRMPMTEMLASTFDPADAISMYCGNVTVEFDRHGNAKKYTGYGTDGRKVFGVRGFNPERNGFATVGLLMNEPRQRISRIVTDTLRESNVVDEKYYDGDTLVWDMKTEYNAGGSVDRITKEYSRLGFEVDGYKSVSADTAEYNYLDYDSVGNWVEVEVMYKGVLPKCSHTYKIKRQLTYWGDPSKKPLIDELESYNVAEEYPVSELVTVPLGEYGEMKIPSYMKLQSEGYNGGVKGSKPLLTVSGVSSLFVSTYDGKDAYATITANIQYEGGADTFDDMPEGNREIDRELEEVFTSALKKDGTYILKWIPYRLVTISGRTSLKMSYYRYGKGSPVPVYCENYNIPLGNGSAICVAFSFQSNQYDRFVGDFQRAIASIKL